LHRSPFSGGLLTIDSDTGTHGMQLKTILNHVTDYKSFVPRVYIFHFVDQPRRKHGVIPLTSPAPPRQFTKPP